MSKYDVSIYTDDLVRLIHITKCACSLYSNRTVENEQEIEEKIKFISQMENEIYEKLDISNQKNGDKILEYFYNLLNRTTYSQEIKDSIEDRVYNYFYYLVNHLPFASTKKTFEQQNIENISKINMQENIDYYRNLMFYLTEYLEKSKNKQEGKIIYETMNAILFQQKFLEKIDWSKTEISGRQRCIIFNFNRDLVDIDYENFCANTINHCINSCLEYSNENLKNIRNKTRFNIILLSMRVGLLLLEKEELINIINYYKNEVILQKSPGEHRKCIEAMTNVIEEIVKEKKDSKLKQKI